MSGNQKFILQLVVAVATVAVAAIEASARK